MNPHQRSTKRFAMSVATVVAQLSAFLVNSEPRVVRMLYRSWGDMRDVVSISDLEDAVSSGQLPPEILEAFREAYSRRINEEMRPVWDLARRRHIGRFARALAANTGISADLPRARGVFRAWVNRRAATLAVDLSVEQERAIRNVISHFAQDDPRTPREIAVLLRPLVGLTARDARAVARSYSRDVDAGLSVEDARARATRYGSKLSRSRATRIARTELATAFHQAQYQTVRSAVRSVEGVETSSFRKVWLTAVDERVCSVCGPLHNETATLNGKFKGGGLASRLPPIHPNCRCTVGYDYKD